MALKKHLADSGRSAKVTVNLERRMGIPEIVHDLRLQKLLDLLIAHIAVTDPCPRAQPVGNGPSCGPKAALLKRNFGRIQPCRCIMADRRSRIESYKLGDMAVLRLAELSVIIFFTVLLYLP